MDLRKYEISIFIGIILLAYLFESFVFSMLF